METFTSTETIVFLRSQRTQSLQNMKGKDIRKRKDRGTKKNEK